MATAHTCQISSISEMVVREALDQLAWNGSIENNVKLNADKSTATLFTLDPSGYDKTDSPCT